MYAFAPSAAAVLADWGADVVKVVPPKVADPMMGDPVAGLPAGGRRRRVHVGDHEPRQAMHRRSTRRTRRRPATCSLDLVPVPTSSSPTCCPTRARRFAGRPRRSARGEPDLVYARASGHGDRGPRAGAGRLRPHRLLGPHRHRPRREHGVRRVRAPARPGARRPLRRRVPRRRHRRRALPTRERTGQGAVVDVSLLSSGMWVFAPAVVASQLYDVETIPRMRHAGSAQPARRRLRDPRRPTRSTWPACRPKGTSRTSARSSTARTCSTDPRFATSKARIGKRPRVHRRPRRDLRRARPRRLARGAPRPVDAVDRRADRRRKPPSTRRSSPTTTWSTSRVRPRTYPLVASPVQFDGEAPSLTRAPDHGEHTEEILLELGRTWDDIAELKTKGAVL